MQEGHGRRWAIGPSAHLSWAELACRDALRTPYPLDWRETRAVQLAEAFEVIREACGGHPITIGSAYRTPEWNAHVGGVEQSQHVQGRALDLYPPEGMAVAAFHDVVLRLAPATMIRFVKRYTWGVHVDCRPSGTIRFETSDRPAPEERAGSG